MFEPALLQPLPSPIASTPPNGPTRWIKTSPGLPYFLDDDGRAWNPVGHNDAITWPELSGLWRRSAVGDVVAHLRSLKDSGVTCLRLMLEYCQGEHRYIERPVGTFNPLLVQFWDDLFGICERIGIHILLTPFDTFFTWIRWKRHPYNRANGGPCAHPSELLTCPATLAAIKNRLEFATRRWGGSPALFAWDIWNEMHPAHAGGRIEPLRDFVSDVAPWLRSLEHEVHGRSHPITVSVFGPELIASPGLSDIIFRHPELDFANIHLYERGTIDNPRNTVAPALATGRLVEAALAKVQDCRPLFDSEHGPIHAFLDRKKMLAEPFDDEYFRHIQWAHLASGGAGGGMRWPNRRPHVLTIGMRAEQSRLAAFLPLIDWTRFRRRCLNQELRLRCKGVAGFACGDGEQFVLWLLRTDIIGCDGMLKSDVRPKSVSVVCPAGSGTYLAKFFDTATGQVTSEQELTSGGEGLAIDVPELRKDLAIAVRRLPDTNLVRDRT